MRTGREGAYVELGPISRESPSLAGLVIEMELDELFVIRVMW
jgi:hypothetical protein